MNHIILNIAFAVLALALLAISYSLLIIADYAVKSCALYNNPELIKTASGARFNAAIIIAFVVVCAIVIYL